jgi:hypothetical protein
MGEVTNLQRARELRAAGLPPNLVVETRHWFCGTSELIFAVDKAQAKFLRKMMAYQATEDERKYDAMIRAWSKLVDAAEDLDRQATDLEKTDTDQASALRGVVDQQITPMLDSFDAIFGQLENREAVSFQIGINDRPAMVRVET